MLSEAQLLRYMPFVLRCEQELQHLGDWWQRVALVGKINSLQVAKTLLDEMEITQHRFQELRQQLVENLAQEKVRKLNLDLGSRAQVAIDILIRNLFERTADVGFLATDGDIRAFLDPASTVRPTEQHILERLRAYTAKYSVYDEIIILDAHGALRTHLNEHNPLTCSPKDPLIAQLMTAQAPPYLEIFRASDLRPLDRRAHLFVARITATDDPHSALLGILCLGFRFDDEMQSIFAHLAQPDTLMAILDEHNTVIASNNEALVPCGEHLRPAAPGKLGLLTYKSKEYIVRTAPTNGYQGYMGLAWRGHVMQPLQAAFVDEGCNPTDTLADESMTQPAEHGGTLAKISQAAARITDDLTLAVLNGQIISAKQDAQEFMPVLNEIRAIGHKTREVFDRSIHSLHRTLRDTLLADASFQASLAVDIMDRNLYERANDVRWWALTRRFREIFAQPESLPAQRQELEGILSYINQLYTVYTNLFLFDLDGHVVAVSNPAQTLLVGTRLPAEMPIAKALHNQNPQQYVVSAFMPTVLYEHQPTYVYMTAIHAPQSLTPVGGIGIVFDATPQFQAMLTDALPHDAHGTVTAGAFGLFVEPNGQIIASTHEGLAIGEHLSLEPHLLRLKNGQRRGSMMLFQGQSYALGAAMSRGYREYKTTNDYKNDIIALIFISLRGKPRPSGR